MAKASSSLEVVLTPDDIPGAKLAEPYELNSTQYTVAALRWWLLCRDITLPTSTKNARLYPGDEIGYYMSSMYSLLPRLALARRALGPYFTGEPNIFPSSTFGGLIASPSEQTRVLAFTSSSCRESFYWH